MSAYAAILNVASLDGVNGFAIPGLAAFDGLYKVSSGDINGDGRTDLFVGASSANSSAGAAYVVFGSASLGASVDLSALDGANGFRLDGGANDQLGFSLGAADINGDGVQDLLAGAFNKAGYAVFGHAGAFSANPDLTALDGSDGLKFTLAGSGHGLAAVIDSAGDVNGDGIEDLLIGASAVSGDDTLEGGAFVVFGKDTGFGATLDLGALNGSDGFRVSGFGAFAETGRGGSAAGDINGDGFDDIIVGMPGADPGARNDAGQAYVIFGKASGFAADLDLQSLGASEGIVLNGEDAGDKVGFLTAPGGDINGDGLDDLLIGSLAGLESYVLFGSTGGFPASIDLADLDGTDGFHLTTGNAVSSAGDFNGDGFGDFVVGTGTSFGPPGSAYIVFGKASGFAADFDPSTIDGNTGIRIDGAAAADSLGIRNWQAGDVNGDGLSDIIIGASGVDTNGNGAGAAYVIYGALPAEAVTRTGTDIGQTIRGGVFNDVLDGRGGRDQLFGNGGGDTLIGGEGKDKLDGGGGVDAASYLDAAAGVSVDLSLNTYQNTGAAGLDYLYRIESLIGSAFGDTLTGSSANNRLEARGGHDLVSGGDGADIIYGGIGNDTVTGGAGADTLTGNKGRDVFAFTAITDSGPGGAARDRITDLESVDTIDVSGIDANLGTGGNQAFTMVASFTNVAGQARLAYSAAKNETYLQLDQDGDGAADFVLTLTGDHRAFSGFVL